MRDHKYDPGEIVGDPPPPEVFAGVGAPSCVVCGGSYADHLDGRTNAAKELKGQPFTEAEVSEAKQAIDDEEHRRSHGLDGE